MGVLGVWSNVPCSNMDLYDGLGVETANIQLKSAIDSTTKQPISEHKKEEEKKPWSSNFRLMASQLQRKKAGRGRGMRGRGRGLTSGVGVAQVSVAIRIYMYFHVERKLVLVYMYM